MSTTPQFLQTFIKDPDAFLDYTLDWSQWLQGDSILSTSFTITGDDAVLQIGFATTTPTTATVWLSGGTDGALYGVTCEVTTAQGRIDDRSFQIQVNER